MLHLRGELTGPPAIFWADKRPTEELYDLVSDPEELKNLAGDSAYSQTLQELRRELDDWIQRTDDQGRFAEADEQAAVDSSAQWYRARMKKRGFSGDIDPEVYLRWWIKELGVE